MKEKIKNIIGFIIGMIIIIGICYSVYHLFSLVDTPTESTKEEQELIKGEEFEIEKSEEYIKRMEFLEMSRTIDLDEIQETIEETDRMFERMDRIFEETDRMIEEFNEINDNINKMHEEYNEKYQPESY